MEESFSKEIPLMNSSRKDTFEKTASQYERKLARQKQLEAMEAAASGVQPAMQLQMDEESSGLRSRSETARRFLSEEEDVPPQQSSIKSSAPISGNLFDVRGRPDGLPVNTGLNLMDHTTGVYQQPVSRVDRMIASLRSMFRETSEFDAAAAEEYVDYRHSKRQSWNDSLARFWSDRNRRSVCMFFLAAAIFLVLVTTFTVRVVHPSEKVLRQQNNKRFNEIMDAIVAEGISHQENFLDYTSPEHHALRWVAYSDPALLHPDDPILLSRYALAVFFYNSFLRFEQDAGRQKPIEIGVKQWEGVPNPGWTQKDHWMSAKGICQWYGVHCTPKRVTNPDTEQTKLITQYDSNEAPIAIKITQNHIMGTLPNAFKALDELKLLDLTSNKITGVFPTHMGRLFKLETLRLPNNKLKGPIPPDFGNLEGVKLVDLRSNDISGSLPTEFGRLYNLETLLLSRNQITGQLPDMHTLHQLKEVYVDHNALSGKFPFTLSMQPSLVEIHLNDNQLTGTIPGEITTIRGLEKLRAENNKLSGTIPRGLFSRMSHLREIALENNYITGTLPEDTSAMVQLEMLSLSGNQFKGSLSHDWGTIQTLQKLHLADNQLTGTIPNNFGNLTSIKELWIQDNSLTGKIPESLGLCSNMETLYAERNELAGTIPSELGRMTGLKTLRLQANDLKGDMPFYVCDLKSLYHLSFLSADCNKRIDCQDDCCSECH